MNKLSAVQNLHIKKEVAELVLSFPIHDRGGFPRTKELYDSQLEHYDKVRVKNQRGMVAV